MTRTKGKARSSRTSPQADVLDEKSLDELVAVGARAVGISVDDSWRPAIRENLRVTLMHGARVTQFALPDDAEPAPVYEA